jgi:hypothetical protein
MLDYVIINETVDGEKTREILKFADDDAAISYALPLARGRLVEVRRSGRLVATVDERPCTATIRQAADCIPRSEFAFA